MALDKEIKLQQTKYREMDNLWMLPATHKIKEGKFRHDQTGAWLYVRLHPWIAKWGVEVQLGPGLIADRAVQVGESRYFVEIDLGTEEFDNGKDNCIRKKIDNYMLYGQYPDKTLFVLESSERRTAKATLEKIRDYVASKRRGNQFLCVYSKALLDDPMGKILYHSLHGYVSFADIDAMAEE